MTGRMGLGGTQQQLLAGAVAIITSHGEGGACYVDLSQS
jgi:hypothetical protein